MLLTTTYKPSKVMFHFLADLLEVTLQAAAPDPAENVSAALRVVFMPTA